MPQHRHRIQFPASTAHEFDQDEAFFYLVEGGKKRRLRFHDYDQIYLRPGLYEQLFYERLKCNSPQVVGELLKRSIDASGGLITPLRVLDLGAGNGLMGEVLKSYGAARLIGADIIPEAKEAAYRDRPHVYDEYYVDDFTQLSTERIEEISDWGIDGLTCVAALGFGDIPPAAFFQALAFVQPGGWVAFNIKETFLDESDTSGFSRLIRELIFSEYLNLHQLQRYRHRLSMDGLPLHYYGISVQKTAEIPSDFLDEHGISKM